MSGMFAPIFNTIQDEALALTEQFSNVVSMFMPAAQAIFIVYCMFVIWSYWENESSIQGTFIDLMKRIVAWGLVLGFGMNISNYQGTIMPMVTHLGTDLSQSFGGGDSTVSSLDDVITQLNSMTQTILQAVEVSNKAEIDAATLGEQMPVEEESSGAIDWMKDKVTEIGDAVSGLTSGVMEAMFGGLQVYLMAWIKVGLLWLAGIIFIGVAFAYMLIAQVMLVILAAVGPLFFMCGLFPATRTYFTNWIGSVLNYGFYFLFVIITVSLSVKYLGKQLAEWQQTQTDAIAAAGTGNLAPLAATIASDFLSVVHIVGMFIVFAIVILQVPSLTSSLFGGLATGGFSTVASAMRSASNLVGRNKPSSPAPTNKGGGGSLQNENAGK